MLTRMETLKQTEIKLKQNMLSYTKSVNLDCANFISKMKTKNNVKWLIFIVILSKSNPLEEKSNRVSLLYYKIYTYFV